MISVSSEIIVLLVRYARYMAKGKWHSAALALDRIDELRAGIA